MVSKGEKGEKVIQPCPFCHTAADNKVKSDEFWDYDRQLDLEAFNSHTLYDVLSRQARDVTRSLGEQKDQVSASFNSSKVERRHVYTVIPRYL